MPIPVRLVAYDDLHPKFATVRSYKDNPTLHERSTASARSSELEQAVIRVLIAGIVCVYMSIQLYAGHIPLHLYVLWVVFGYFLFSIAFVFAVRLRGTNAAGRYLSLVSDLGMTTLAAYEGGELLAPFFPIYLWIILGYGIRYGQHTLLVGALLGTMGFGFVVRSNEYWLSNVAPAMGMLLTLVVIPVFVSVLIRNIERSKQEAIAANAAKSRFLANMSHEIRTPLTGIIGLADMLYRDNVKSEHKEQIATIGESARTLLYLIEDVLDISKIEAEKIVLSRRAFNLAQLIEDTAKIVGPTANSKDVCVETDITELPKCEVVGDPVRLKQVLLNLVSNAVKFTESGRVTLTANGRSVPGKLHVRIEVTDTGIGIAPEHLQRIFEEFVQADDDSSRKRYAGSGLGTTIARRLVHLMDGSIGAESALGIGSTFWVELPLDRSSEAPVPAKSAGPHPTPQPSDGRSLNLLVVEDTPTNRMVITLILERAGHAVTTAENGEEALRSLSAENFDLVIVDYQMPVIGGLDVMRTYRFGADPQCSVPFVVLTAHATTDIRQECEDAGADAFLTKPIDPTSLLEVISSLGAAAVPPSREYDSTPETLDDDIVRYLISVSPDPQRLLIVFDRFAVDTKADMFEMRKAARDRDLASFHTAAHAFKGSAGSIGAARLTQLATCMYEISTVEGLEDTSALFHEVEVCLEETRQAWARVVQDAPSDPHSLVDRD